MQSHKQVIELSFTDLIEFPKRWKDYKIKFKKVYKNEEEEKMRKELFFERYKLIEIHNKKYKKHLVPYKIVTTALSDRTDEEIRNAFENQTVSKATLSDEEEWAKFKARTNKKFKNGSEEEIPKYFFLARIQELRKEKSDFKKSGVAPDYKEIDKYCDFNKFNKVRLESKIEVEKNARKRGTLSFLGNLKK